MVDALAAGVRKAAAGSGVHKGPRDAVIRQATDGDEAERAFADEGGSITGDTQVTVAALPGENAARGPGGRGSTAGVRVGSRSASDPGGGLDARAAQIAAEKAAKRAGQRSAPGQRLAAAAPAAARQTPELEDWELEAARGNPGPAAVAAATPRLAPVSLPPAGGDILASAQNYALRLLASLPAGTEIFVGQTGLEAQGAHFMLGLGVLIGKGLAAYRGENHYRITAAGMAAAQELTQ